MVSNNNRLSKDESKQEIDSILHRLRRSKATGSPATPNQAEWHVGKRLAIAYSSISGVDDSTSNEIIELLISSTTSTSVSFGFFETLSTQQHCVDEAWIVQWIRMAQDEDHETLTAMISFYAQYSRQQVSLSPNDQDNRIAQVYVQLKSSQRLFMFHTFCEQATSPQDEALLVRPLLSSLMGASLLSLSTPLVERSMIVDVLFRACWKYGRSATTSGDDQVVELCSWLTDCLDMFLDGIRHSADESTLVDMAHGWLAQVSDLLETVVRVQDNDRRLTRLVSDLVTTILPRFLEFQPARSMKTIVDSLLQVTRRNNCVLANTKEFTLSLAINALSTPISKDIYSMLHLIQQTASKEFPIAKILACIFGSDDYETISHALRSVPCKTLHHDLTCTILGISSPQDVTTLLEIASEALVRLSDSEKASVKVTTQNSFLLVACCTLLEDNNTSTNPSTQTFVKTLLQIFPLLSIPLLPVLLDWVQQQNPNGAVFLQRLEFLCRTVVHEPHCATEVWNLVGLTLAHQSSTSLVVRLAAIQMYPILCEANHRLYRRIVNSLATMMEERKQEEIRLAVITVVYKLAKQDLIRDVSDIIGWVQTFLQEKDNPATAHLAILTLHHLVMNDELDFDLTMKVLMKRLCLIGDVNQVVALPPLVIEALVVLLGDGEAGGAITSWGSTAISTLVTLVDIDLPGQDDASAQRSLSNILQSLSQYSPGALGLEEDAIKTSGVAPSDDTDKVVIPEASKRYKALSTLCSKHMLGYSEVAESVALKTLISKIVSQEEEHLGASVWQKGQKTEVIKTSAKSIPKKASRSALSALPSPSSVFDLYDDQPSAATSIASLLTFDGKDIEHLADFASDMSQEENRDPILFALGIQGWLNAMARVWDHISVSGTDSLAERVEDVINDLGAFSDNGVDSDYVNLAISCFMVHVPDSFELPDGSGTTIEFTESICGVLKDIEAAFVSHHFTNIDIGNISLSFVAIRSLHLGDVETFSSLLASLEMALEGGSNSSGLFLGLASIARAIPIGNAWTQSNNTGDRKRRKVWAGRILSLFLQQLGLCLESSTKPVVALVAALAGASTQPGLAQGIKDMGPLTIQRTSSGKARSLLLSLAASLTCLVEIEAEFIGLIFLLMRHLPSGSGREYVLTSILSNPELREIVKAEDWLDADGLANGDITIAYLLTTLDDNKENPNAWLEQNRNSLRGDSLVDIITLLGSIPLLAQRETSLLAQPNLLPHVSVRDVVSALEILNEDASDMSIVVRGMMASMTLPKLRNAGLLSSSSKVSRSATSQSIETSKLPIPRIGTLLHDIVTPIREKTSQKSSHVTTLARLVGYLEQLSLPASFAAALIEPLIFGDEDEVLQHAAISLLISQFTGRRRAAFEGKDFVALGSRVMTTKSVLLLSNGSNHIFGGMTDLLRRCSTDSIESILAQSWENCANGVLEVRKTEHIIEWLKGMKSLLSEINTNQSLALSPRTVSVVHDFVVNTCFASLTSLSATHKVDSAFDLLAHCLVELPRHTVEPMLLIDPSSDQVETLWRVRCMVALIGTLLKDDNEKSLSVISTMLAWLSQQEVTASNMSLMIKILLLATMATKNLDKQSQFQVVAMLMESMLVGDPNSLALPLLSLLLNAWEDDSGSLACLALTNINHLPNLSDATFTSLIQQVQKDLLLHIGSFAHRSKSGRVISNRLLETIKVWKEKDAPSQVLDLLLKMACRCKSRDTPEGETITTTSMRLM